MAKQKTVAQVAQPPIPGLLQLHARPQKPEFQFSHNSSFDAGKSCTRSDVPE